ncbi:hypothetical protein [Bacillus sp. Marseille-P3800]|uniref:hypothetical protein n=1 Tax=Bacillus sp. Marseille-P3800 TaxID=2014782 RepID=UPI00159B8540|nr:hypothetical protein [Bacillus sp. Marseille-P3800]
MKKVSSVLAVLFIMSSFTFVLGSNEVQTVKQDNTFTESVAEFQTKGRGENGYV